MMRDTPAPASTWAPMPVQCSPGAAHSGAPLASSQHHMQSHCAPVQHCGVASSPQQPAMHITTMSTQPQAQLALANTAYPSAVDFGAARPGPTSVYHSQSDSTAATSGPWVASAAGSRPAMDPAEKNRKEAEENTTLPNDWKSFLDPETQRFYYCQVDAAGDYENTTWTKPAGRSPEPQPAVF